MLLATGEEIRRLDHETIVSYGLPGIALMENAGKGATDVLCGRVLGPRQGAHVGIFCGAGNNGGDGYVVARHLLARGHRATIVLLAPHARIAGDAAVNLAVVQKMSVPVVRLADDVVEDDGLEAALATLGATPFDAFVDALLGTGLSSPVRGRYERAITWLNASSVPVLAIDIPSGLHADTGWPWAVAVRARATATFGLAKPGLMLDPGREHAGEVHVVDLGFPARVVDAAELSGEAVDLHSARALVPPRPRATHKGTCGHVFALAGAAGKAGAAILTGVGALRAGAGLVTVGTQAAVVGVIPTVAWELMSAPLVPNHAFDDDARDTLAEALARASVVAVGPGLGDTPLTSALLEALAECFAGPVVVDADGLNAIARDRTVLQRFRGPLILTPHPGEMARLAGCDNARVVQDPLGVARTFAGEHGVTLVLKTAATVVAGPSGRYAINTSGTPGMASAGMGDVLTGVIAGLAAQGLSPWDAARLGVFVHGLAGEHGAERTGQRGLTARALLDALPGALAVLEQPTTS